MNLSINPCRIFPSFAGSRLAQSAPTVSSGFRASEGVDTFEITRKPDEDEKTVLKVKFNQVLN